MRYDYIDLIRHLNITFHTAYTLQAKKSFTIQDFSEADHILLQVHSGQVSYEKAGKQEVIHRNQILFIPSGEPVSVTYGHFQATSMQYSQLLTQPHQYLQPTHYLTTHATDTIFSCIHFRTQAFQAFDLFTMLNLSPILLRQNQQLEILLLNIWHEQIHTDAAQEHVRCLYTKLLVITLLRYFNNQKELIEILRTKQHYFLEERLLSILQHIHANLYADLSNSQLAAIANISEDYMGQYFRALTGINPQTYIENQRLQEAMALLRNTNNRIYHISKQVGFRDQTYFCRRFKRKFGVQANRIKAWKLLKAHTQ